RRPETPGITPHVRQRAGHSRSHTGADRRCAGLLGEDRAAYPRCIARVRCARARHPRFVPRHHYLVSSWHLDCSACDYTQAGSTLASVCPTCGQPFLVRYDSPWPARDAILPRWDMWRYAPVMPLVDGEKPITLGEGTTPMQE